jgi:uncharacterized protein (DUF924 family)
MNETAAETSPADIIRFWFSDTDRRLWFRSTPAFDALIRTRFSALWRAARDTRLTHWEDSPDGALALVIVLDQFPLHMFRNEPASFATEAAARQVADAAIGRGFDQRMTGAQKAFLYLPFMHSEHLPDQERAVSLFEAAGLEENLRWARHHRDIVRRFGRFPHRNNILGRPATAEEVRWLESPGAFRG